MISLALNDDDRGLDALIAMEGKMYETAMEVLNEVVEVDGHILNESIREVQRGNKHLLTVAPLVYIVAAIHNVWQDGYVSGLEGRRNNVKRLTDREDVRARC